jgi:prephenate dehydrogenase
VAIIGLGLLGGSLGLALKKSGFSGRISGYGRREHNRTLALSLGAADEVSTDVIEAVKDADLVILATPVAAILDTLPRLQPHLSPNALVTDVGSTKKRICALAAAHFTEGPMFLGGHPMAGKEQSGVEHADAKLFRGAPYALMSLESDSDARVMAFAEIVRAIGARPVWTDPETHDWAVGIVSHLPQLVSVALARVVQDETDETGLPLSLSGPGLQDMLRLAGSPYDIWRDILLTNTDNVSRALDRLAQAVDYLRTSLARKELQQEFQAANELYRQLKKPV